MTRETLQENEERARWFLDTYVVGGLGIPEPEEVTFVQTSDDEGFAQAVYHFPTGESYRVEVQAIQP